MEEKCLKRVSNIKFKSMLLESWVQVYVERVEKADPMVGHFLFGPIMKSKYYKPTC